VRLFPTTESLSETNTEIKTGINPVIKDYFMLKQSSVSHAKITNRLTLLHEIIRISDAHDKLLSDSACAKARLFAHWAKFEDEPKDAAQIVRLLNLNDRVCWIWMRGSSTGRAYPFSQMQRLWMDDYGDSSGRIISVCDVCHNKIVGDFFKNLAPPVPFWYRTGNNQRYFPQAESKMTLETVQRNLKKVGLVSQLLCISIRWCDQSCPD
jgi:hypothetical protein